ncbi:MltR family transcriptional regulator [Tardiphaga robiniae]|uniref:Uncharacterized protein n=1 Tax=Tardiphaga robiniae TaxID=943830 RepID=A0A7G6TTC5_9BRAD|nr:MltR family transcriptional regulator [Tardiphaga robiniae]QND70007.1 hypothetical protein HB776_01185 [Tardiphaga robiniae]
MPKRDDYYQGAMGISEFADVQGEVGRQTDRGAAIISSSFVEEHLRYAIDRSFVDLSERTSSRLFEGTGPLSTFHSRILLGFALGMYDQQTREEMIIISRIRNFFAHTIKAIDFNDATIAQLCAELGFPSRYMALYQIDQGNRWKFELSCRFCRSIVVNASRSEKPTFAGGGKTSFEALAEARYAAELHGRSVALPHVPSRTSDR